MDPRKPSSTLKKSTALPEDLVRLIRETILEEHRAIFRTQELIVEGRIFKEEIFVRIGILEENSLRQMNFEASVDYTHMKDDSVQLIHACVDALDSMLIQYVEAAGDIELPPQWTKFDFEQRAIYLQISRVNSNLENQANALLLEHGILPDGTDEDEHTDPFDLERWIDNPPEDLKH